jgi:hypothetical protein
MFTGDTVKVTASGTLLDGQHRLMAWVAAGCPAGRYFIVVRGIHPDAQLVMDRHAKRRLHDCLSLSLNVTASSRIVGALNVIGRVGPSGTLPKAPAMTDTELAEAFIDWNDVFLVVDPIMGSKCRAPILAAIMQYVRYDETRGLDFARRVATGEMLGKDDPAYKLRAYIENNSGLSSGGSAVFGAYQNAVAAIAAHHSGRLIGALRPHLEWPFAVTRINRDGIGGRVSAAHRAGGK